MRWPPGTRPRDVRGLQEPNPPVYIDNGFYSAMHIMSSRGPRVLEKRREPAMEDDPVPCTAQRLVNSRLVNSRLVNSMGWRRPRRPHRDSTQRAGAAGETPRFARLLQRSLGRYRCLDHFEVQARRSPLIELT